MFKTGEARTPHRRRHTGAKAVDFRGKYRGEEADEANAGTEEIVESCTVLAGCRIVKQFVWKYTVPLCREGQ